MKMIERRCGCLLLVATLLLGMIPTAFAAPTPGMDNFKRINTYTTGTFSDVEEGRWYTPSIKAAYEYGLALGSNGKFDRTANMKVSEAVTLAARLHCIYNTGSTASLVQGSPWYKVYVDYALANGIIGADQFTNYNAVVSRAQCAIMLSKAIPASELPAINTVEDGAIPDVAEDSPYYDDIYTLYRAGILTGNDTKGTFTPDEPIDRVSMITIATRMVDEGLRKSLLLTKEYSGTCGKNATWHLKDGTLTIRGSGEMNRYRNDGRSSPPWALETENNAALNVQKIVIEEGITYIGDYAFYNCNKATEVSISNSVLEIGFHAFQGCSNLTSVAIPDSVIEIDAYVFSGCTSLTSVIIPDSVIAIGERAFSRCANLTSVTIPDSVIAIGIGAFEHTNLTSVIIPDSVTTINSLAFSNCTNLTSITIPDGVTTIGNATFSGCTNLTSITIPDSVIEIDAFVFSGCTSLTSVIIPDSVTTINSLAFSNCTNLTVKYYSSPYMDEYVNAHPGIKWEKIG